MWRNIILCFKGEQNSGSLKPTTMFTMNKSQVV